ncbi:hypothetical protein LSH36_2g08062 [Paralvinella palmiformis]|uniref:Uncharacterized protein n=1 Tax=Paralvinella palmiformis TaxID=53620 RepID=A0AAD9KHC1_9ANNE|nr:hypothetical protein LSH36_2g08062 [Paralvinella palmiformis]
MYLCFFQELTRLNVEASLMCLISQVEALLKGDLQSCHWLDDISPLVIKLQKCVELDGEFNIFQRLLLVLFKDISLHSQAKPELSQSQYKSSNVTTATSAFMAMIRSSVHDESFLRQLFQIGILMEFESLLSCHGDEVWMLEDMAVGINDLSTVSFKIMRSSSAEDNLPNLRGNRTGYVLEIPVPECLFELMPREIQKGHLIQVVPVIFNIGINEQASLAGRFGDMSLQEAINAESYERLYPYFEKFNELVENKVPDESHTSSAFSLDLLMRELQVCRKLNGLRFANCKSGKDRTSMSVTLEQVRILQQSHDLASHVFMQALNCMRSEGVRRENTLKNCGSTKYAFNAVQLMAFPKLYRPPNGTYGFAET